MLCTFLLLCLYNVANKYVLTLVYICQLFAWNMVVYVTGFAKRVLPHTSNSTNLEDHNLVIKWYTMLKLFPAINLCWCFLLTKLQVKSVNQSEVMNRQKLVNWMCVGNPFLQIWSHMLMIWYCDWRLSTYYRTVIYTTCLCVCVCVRVRACIYFRQITRAHVTTLTYILSHYFLHD